MLLKKAKVQLKARETLLRVYSGARHIIFYSIIRVTLQVRRPGELLILSL